MHCANCGTELKGAICHECGQRRFDKRWTIRDLSSQFVSQLTNIERGFIHTAIMLFKAPGRLVQDYWKGRTKAYYNPFRYTLILVAINILVSMWLGIDDMVTENFASFEDNPDFSSDQMLIAEQNMWNWLNILVLLIIPVMALTTFLLFRNKRKNYAEHLIMNTFIYGQQSLITTVTHIIFFLVPSLFSGYMVFNFAVGLLYQGYVFNKTFDQPWWLVLLKAFVVGIVGMAVLMGIISAFVYMYLFLSGS